MQDAEHGVGLLDRPSGTARDDLDRPHGGDRDIGRRLLQIERRVVRRKKTRNERIDLRCAHRQSDLG